MGNMTPPTQTEKDDKKRDAFDLLKVPGAAVSLPLYKTIVVQHNSLMTTASAPTPNQDHIDKTITHDNGSEVSDLLGIGGQFDDTEVDAEGHEVDIEMELDDFAGASQEASEDILSGHEVQ